jgi:hypothetical protein
VNESGFIRALHTKLPKEIYRWKISDRFSSGVADTYYSTPKIDLWIEYKFYPKGLPKRVKPKLSRLQLKWLRERYNEGRNVFVVVGSPSDCLIFKDQSWETHKVSKDEAISRKELITWMEKTLCTT